MCFRLVVLRQSFERIYTILLYFIILFNIIYFILYHSIIPNFPGLPTGPYDKHQVNDFLTDLKGYYRRIVEDAEKTKVGNFIKDS